jgi:RNA polymerase sigma-70 factor, ECF subfamily
LHPAGTMARSRDSTTLLRQYRAGDPKACEEMYWLYVGQVETIVREGVLRFGGGRDAPASRRAEVADLVQEIFLKAFSPRTRLGYDGSRPFAPYLYAIARNVLVDWARARGREVPTEDWILEVSLQGASEPSPPAYSDPRTMDLLERFVRSLPPDLRAVHEQRYVVGLSQMDAAKALGLSRQAVRTLEGRLRQRLQEALDVDELESALALSRMAARWER